MNYPKMKGLLVSIAILFNNTNVYAQTQIGADILGDALGDYSGQAVSMPDASTVAIGARYHSGPGFMYYECGHVRIFTWNGSAWTLKGAGINGKASGDWSGEAVSMPDANTVAIGAPNSDSNGTQSGQVRVFSWDGSAWIQKGADLDGDTAYSHFGKSLSMPDSNNIGIGAMGHDSTSFNGGYVQIYFWNGNAWIQKGTTIYGESTGDLSGHSVSMPDINTVAIGAPDNDGGQYNAGHVRIYSWNGSAWIQRGIDIDGSNTWDQLGFVVSMSDANNVAVGAPSLSGNQNAPGYVRVFNIPPLSAQNSHVASLNVRIYPNPSYGRFTLDCTSRENIPYSIKDEVGHIAATGTVEGSHETIDLSQYSPGIYFLELHNYPKPIHYKLVTLK